MRTGRESSTSGYKDLPLSKLTSLALSRIDKFVSELHQAFLKAFHPATEEAHEAKYLYQKIYDLISIWFPAELSEKISKFSYSEEENKIFIASIKKFFHKTKVSLITGTLDEYSKSTDEYSNSGYADLYERKRKILCFIIDLYEQIALYKYFMTMLSSSEFVRAENEIESIYCENKLERYKHQTYKCNIFSESPLGHIQEYNSLIGLEYGKRTNQAIQCCHQIIHSYQKLDSEINYLKTFIIREKNSFAYHLSLHNEESASRIEINKQIDDLHIQIQNELHYLNAQQNIFPLNYYKMLEKNIPAKINLLREKLNAIANQKQVIADKYYNNALALKKRYQELILLIEKQKNKLREHLASMQVFPDIPEPPDFSEILKSSSHPAYIFLENEVKETERLKKELEIESIRIHDSAEYINEIHKKCMEMAGHTSQFYQSQLKLFSEVQKDINLIIKNFNAACEDQSTIKWKPHIDGLTFSWVETDGHQGWKDVAKLISENLSFIYDKYSNIREIFLEFEHADQANEERTITKFINVKKKEIDKLFLSRLEALITHSNELTQKISDCHQSMSEIKASLKEELKSIYELACHEKEILVGDRQYYSKFTEKINQLDGEYDQQKLLVKEKQDLPEIEELEKHIGELDLKLEKLKCTARIEISEKFYLISSIDKRIKDNLDKLARLGGIKEFYEEYNLITDEYETLTQKFTKSFQEKNVFCGPKFHNEFTVLADKLDKLVNKIEKAHEVTVSKIEKTNFWSRHKAKIIGAIMGFTVGAGAGATIGALLAPATFGLSVPVCAVICGGIGAMIGAAGGVFGGSMIDCCLQTNSVSDEIKPVSTHQIKDGLFQSVKSKSLLQDNNQMNDRNASQFISTQSSLSRFFQPVDTDISKYSPDDHTLTLEHRV